MSTLAVGTIKSVSSAPPVFQNSSGTEKGQLAKMWANFTTEGTDTLNDSFNVSSLTDIGGNSVRLNFSTSFSNTNYAVVCSAIESSSGGANSRTPRVANPTQTALSTGSVNICACDLQDNSQAVYRIFVVCFGDN